MVRDLKNYQSQVNAYKFEIERLDKEIGQVKQLYFNSKEKQIQDGDDNYGQDMQQNLQNMQYDPDQQPDGGGQVMQDYAQELNIAPQGGGGDMAPEGSM